MLDLRDKFWSFLYCIFFYLNRIIFSLSVVFLAHSPFIQIVIFIFTAIAQMIILGFVRPLKTSKLNRLELFNSYTSLVSSYCLLCFTFFVPDAQIRNDIGYVLILLVVINTVVNLITVASEPASQIYGKIKIAYLKKYGSKQNAAVPKPKLRGNLRIIQERGEDSEEDDIGLTVKGSWVYTRDLDNWKWVEEKQDEKPQTKFST